MKQTMSSMLKKIVLATISAMVFFGPAFAAFPETRFLATNVPHYYEFNTAENPTLNYWCGHAALKVAMMQKANVTKTLGTIHNTFYNNSAGYRANNYCIGGGAWCASLQDLAWSASLSQNGGYGRSASRLATSTERATAAAFYTTIRNSIIANQPVIVPSGVTPYSDWGHFWVVVGYTDKATPETSVIYVRDVAIPSPAAGNADAAYFVQTFYDASQSPQGIKGQMLLIK
jgi:Peptidase_C39 like family